MNFKYRVLYSFLGFVSMLNSSATKTPLSFPQFNIDVSLDSFISKQKKLFWIKQTSLYLQEEMQYIKKAYDQWDAKYNQDILAKPWQGLDFYAILSLQDSADAAIILAFYNRLSSKIHIDKYAKSTPDTDAEVMRILSCKGVAAQKPPSQDNYLLAIQLLEKAFATLGDPAQKAEYDTHVKEIRDLKIVHAKIFVGLHQASIILKFLEAAFQALIKNKTVTFEDIDKIRAHVQHLIDEIQGDLEGSLQLQTHEVLSDHLQALLNYIIQDAKKTIQGIAVGKSLIDFRDWLQKPDADVTKPYDIYDKQSPLQYAIIRNNMEMAELVLIVVHDKGLSLLDLTAPLAQHMKDNVAVGNTALNNGIWLIINTLDTRIFHVSDTKVGPLANALTENFMRE